MQARDGNWQREPWPVRAEQARRRIAMQVFGAGVLLVMLAWGGGCTRESLRVALEAQQRADQVQRAVFDRQHQALRLLLFRDLVDRLEEDGARLSDGQLAALNAAWNARDLAEFWAVQHERAAALRMAGVDAQLYSGQAVIDLLTKSAVAGLKRLETGIAAAAGEALDATPDGGK